MRPSTVLIAVTCLATLLVGCNSSTSASKYNFAKAINVMLAKRSNCIRLVPNVLGNTTYPWTIKIYRPGEFSLDGTLTANKAKQENAKMFSQLNAMVKAGLFTSTDIQVNDGWPSNKLVPAIKYSLTEAGKRALQSPKSIAFCMGHFKVTKIVSYTEPGRGLGGTMQSQVKFTYIARGVPAWATSSAINYYAKNLAAAITHPQKGGSADVRLMNNGWKAEFGAFGGLCNNPTECWQTGITL